MRLQLTARAALFINITASSDIGLDEVDLASSMIAKAAHPEANIIWGAAFDESYEDEMKITVIATGFDDSQRPVSSDLSSVGSADASGETKASDDGYFDDILNLLNKRK